MKPTPWWLLGFALLATSAHAGLPPGIDIYEAILEKRIKTEGIEKALNHNTAHVIETMLEDPASPYSDTNAQPRFTNDLRWQSIVHSFDSPSISSETALNILQWDLGLTRARPGIDVAVPSVHDFRDPFIAANVIKADVDADIFWQARDMAGNRYSTVAAVYAVALQILRKQVADVPADRHTAMGIDAAVVKRFMEARSPDRLREDDLRYLNDLIVNRIGRWQVGDRDSHGERALPIAYRVARIAAAYRDQKGYITGTPCLRDGTPDPRLAGQQTDEDNRPLCFVAATDRAIHRWYLDERTLELKGELPNQHSHEGLHRLLTVVFDALALLDFVAFVETAESSIATLLADREIITEADEGIAASRESILFCSRSAP